MNKAVQTLIKQYQETLSFRQDCDRRVAIELTFPLVFNDGRPVDKTILNKLWPYMISCGWRYLDDSPSPSDVVWKTLPSRLEIMATQADLAKVTFSFSPADNMDSLAQALTGLQTEVQAFCSTNEVSLLCYGIHPRALPHFHEISRPQSQIDTANPDLKHLDIHTIKKYGHALRAASCVSVEVGFDDACAALNVLNGFAAAQIALTANSNIWLGQLSEEYKCVGEKLRDWCSRDSRPQGVPLRPFHDMEDYARILTAVKPQGIARLGRSIRMTR